MSQKSVGQTRLAQSKCNFRMSQKCSTVVRTVWPVLPTVYLQAELVCVCSVSQLSLCHCCQGITQLHFLIGVHMVQSMSIYWWKVQNRRTILPPFCRLTLEWIVLWHLVWLFKTSFVFVGVHCWSWLSLPTGCSQTWYLSYVVCMCCTLNYMSNKCPDFMAKSLFLHTHSFSPNLNICMVLF